MTDITPTRGINDTLQSLKTTESPFRLNHPGGFPVWTEEGLRQLVLSQKLRLGLSFVALLFNVVVLLIQVKLKTFRRTKYLFGLSLNVADLVFAISVLLETGFYLSNRTPIPSFLGALIAASNLQAFLSIIAVALDRYLALCMFPLNYKYIITTNTYGVVIGIICGVSLSYGCLTTRIFSVGDPFAILLHSLSTSLLILISLTLYVLVGISLLRSFRKLRLPQSVRKTRLRQTKRIMLAFGLILLTNDVCIIPESYFGFWLFLQPPYERYGLMSNIIIANWFYTTRTLNSAINPLIYWWQFLWREFFSEDSLRSNFPILRRDCSNDAKNPGEEAAGPHGTSLTNC